MEVPPQAVPQPRPIPQRKQPEAIESCGTGLAQIRMGLLAAPVRFADGAELLLISSVTDAVSQELDFSAAQRGLVVSAVYLGVLAGNILSGPLGDLIGRRLPILVSVLCILIFSLLSAVAWGFHSLCSVRFLVGASIGIGQPAQQALVSETTPTKWRIIFSSLGMLLFSFGEIYSGFLILADDPHMLNLQWRILLVAGALPSAIFGLLCFAFLTQSHIFLACEGKYDDARVILQSMRAGSSASDVRVDFLPRRVACGGSGVQSHFRRMLGIVFGPEHITLTLTLIASCFTLNLCYYGSLYAFPSVLARGVKIGSTPAGAIIFGGLAETAGYVVGVFCVLGVRRLMVMKVYLASMTAGLVAFALGAPVQGGGLIPGLLTMYGYYASKFSVSIGFLVFYLYAFEAFPTPARAAGTAVVFAGGRAAAPLSSLVYELLLSAFGRFDVFFFMMAALCSVNFCLINFFTVETFGTPLQDSEDAPENGEKPGYGSTCAHCLDLSKQLRA